MPNTTWLDVLSTGISAAGQYLVTREQLRAQREAAKYGGGGVGMDTIMTLLQMGMTMGGAGVAAQTRQQAVPRYYYPSPFGTIPTPTPTPGIPQSTTPVPTPIQIPATTGGQPVAVTTAPYVQTSGEVVPFPGQQLWSWLQGQPQGGGGIINAPQVFNQTQGGYRAKSFFAVPNPMTGNLSYFRNAGRPILFSGDLSACKRVNKVASRARRASPRRRATTRKR